MLSKIKEIVSNSIILILVITPYLINYIIINSISIAFLCFIAVLIILEVIYQKLSTLIRYKFNLDINYIIFPTLLIVFYYYLFISLINHANNLTFQNSSIIASHYIPIFWIILLLFYYWISQKVKGIYTVINSFFIIFSGTIYLTNPNSSPKENLKTLDGHFIQINESYTKPVILIILDEYSSPAEIYKNKADSSIFEFNKTLKSCGWKFNNDQYSNNLITAYCLSSLFNYNFKLKDSCLSINQSLKSLRESTLIRDLQKKGVAFHNYGIFDIGRSKAFSKIYFYEEENFKTNFLKHLFAKSIIGKLYGLDLFNKKQLYHNSFLMENGYKKIKPYAGKKSFFYIHLMMPHYPFEYKGVKKFENNKNFNQVENYIQYWYFTNSLVQEQLLYPLVKSNQFKIIVTGDHGYRGDKEKFNPHKTYTAYYGFDPAQLENIKSVQDLGSLIYANY